MSDEKEAKPQSNLQIIANLLLKAKAIQFAFAFGLVFILIALAFKIYTSDTFSILGVGYGTCEEAPKVAEEEKPKKRSAPKLDAEAIEDKIMRNLMNGNPDDEWADPDEDDEMQFGE